MNPAETTLTIHAQKTAIDFLQGDAASQTLFERDGDKVNMRFDEIVVEQVNPGAVRVTYLHKGKSCAEMLLACHLSAGQILSLIGIEGRIGVSLG